MRNRSIRRKLTHKKETKRLKLAKSLGIHDTNHARLAKNGWACNCGICKPYRMKPSFKTQLTIDRFHSELKQHKEEDMLDERNYEDEELDMTEEEFEDLLEDDWETEDLVDLEEEDEEE